MKRKPPVYVDVDLEPDLIQVAERLWLPIEWSPERREAFLTAWESR